MVFAAFVHAQGYQPAREWPVRPVVVEHALVWRSTIIVDDLDASKALFRDALGFEPVYAQAELADPRLEAFLGLAPGEKMRLIVMRAGTEGAVFPNAGYIGLAQIIGGAPLEPTASRDRVRKGDVALMLMARDVLAIQEKLERLPSVRITSRAERRSDGSASEILAITPEGTRLWITQRDPVPLFLEPKLSPSASGAGPATAPVSSMPVREAAR